MEKHLEQSNEFEKVEILRSLFNQCSLNELLIIKQLHSKKVFYKMAVKSQSDEMARAEDMFEKIYPQHDRDKL